MKKLIFLAIMLILCLGLFQRTVRPADPVDIIDTATANGLTEFVGAVATSDLTDSAKGKGPFTVFAPNNAAFTAAGLAKTRDAMRPVIKFHVVPGKEILKDQLKSERLETIEGNKLEVLSTTQVKGQNETATIQNSLKCSNGVIHVIDKVLTPTKMDAVE